MTKSPVYSPGDSIQIQNVDNPETLTLCTVLAKRPIKPNDGHKSKMHEYDIEMPNGEVVVIIF